MQPQQGMGMLGGGDDPDKAFKAEAENLEVLEPTWVCDGIEARLIKKFS